jgi:hypothetical protein
MTRANTYTAADRRAYETAAEQLEAAGATYAHELKSRYAISRRRGGYLCGPLRIETRDRAPRHARYGVVNGWGQTLAVAEVEPVARRALDELAYLAERYGYQRPATFGLWLGGRLLGSFPSQLLAESGLLAYRRYWCRERSGSTYEETRLVNGQRRSTGAWVLRRADREVVGKLSVRALTPATETLTG